MYNTENGVEIENQDVEAYMELEKGIFASLNNYMEYYSILNDISPTNAAVIVTNICLKYAAELACKTRILMLGGLPDESKFIDAALVNFDLAVENTKDLITFGSSDGGLKESVRDIDEIVREHFKSEELPAYQPNLINNIQQSGDEYLDELISEWNKLCTPESRIIT
jgi:hypothetical protein